MGAEFGALFKRMRERQGLTLRRFCLENGLDPGNLSKMERGRLPPPGREKLEQYAGYLGLEKGSPEWVEFYDLAFADRGEIPDDILQDEELAGKLPLVFRTLRGEKLSPEELDRLVEKIRRA